jgi:glycine cleavage system H protein
MRIPDSLLYSTKHLWAKPAADGIWEAGITDYAQDLLGDVVFIDPPKVGSTLVEDKPCGLVESVKTGSDLHALVDGEVIEVNEALLGSPELINDKPYEAWIFKFKSAVNLQEKLIDSEAYKKLIAEL